MAQLPPQATVDLPVALLVPNQRPEPSFQAGADQFLAEGGVCSNHGRTNGRRFTLDSEELKVHAQAHCRLKVDSLDAQHGRTRPQHGPTIVGNVVQVRVVRVSHLLRSWPPVRGPRALIEPESRSTRAR